MRYAKNLDAPIPKHLIEDFNNWQTEYLHDSIIDDDQLYMEKSEVVDINYFMSFEYYIIRCKRYPP